MPTPNEVHVDAALTGVSVAYSNTDYVADTVAPAVPVRKQSDRYYVYDEAREWLRPSVDARAPGTPAGEVDYALSTDSYFCADHALEAAVPDEERENADTAIAPDIDRTEFLTEKLMLNREIELASLLGLATVPGKELEGAACWDDPASDPIGDLNTAHASVASGIQRRANTLLVSQKVFDALANHPAIVDRVKYTSAAAVTEDILARLLQLDRVAVGRAYRNAALPGRSPSMTPVWGRFAYLLYVTPRPGLRNMGALSTFTWNGPHMTENARGYVVDKWREPARKSDMIRVQRYYDQKLVAPYAAYRITNAVSG